MNRTINREKLGFKKFEKEINCKGHIRKMVYDKYSALLKVRSREKAFSPYASQKIIDFGKSFFALLRGSNENKILCIVNLSSKSRRIKGDIQKCMGARKVKDVILGRIIKEENPLLKPFEVLWLKKVYRRLED